MYCDIDSNSMELNNNNKWAFSTARYVVCILTVLGVKTACLLLYDVARRQRDLDVRLLNKIDRHKVVIYVILVAILYNNGEKFYADEFHLVLAAFLIVKYMDMTNGLNLTYGVGMACSYVEGYLDFVIPSDGMDYKGFMGNLENFQSNQGVIFPVKKLFIIMTKSMYSPPDLKDFNISTDREGVPWLEACSSIGQMVRDVAGVKNRLYGTSAYKINRVGKRPVYICAEGVGSFSTFYNVMKNTILYEELVNVSVEEIVSDFITMLRRVLPKSLHLKDKIELVYFDDSKGLNLADVLLDRVREMVPDFEDIIAQRY